MAVSALPSIRGATQAEQLVWKRELVTDGDWYVYCILLQGMVACEDGRASHVPSERSWRRVQVRSQ